MHACALINRTRRMLCSQVAKMRVCHWTAPLPIVVRNCSWPAACATAFRDLKTLRRPRPSLVVFLRCVCRFQSLLFQIMKRRPLNAKQILEYDPEWRF